MKNPAVNKNCILIISEETPTVGEIMKWLDSFGVSFLRVNDSDRCIRELSIRIGRDALGIRMANEDGAIDFTDLAACFTRHGHLGYQPLPKFLRDTPYPELYENVRDQHTTVMNFLYDHLRAELPGLGSATMQDSNKLIALKAAADVGLLIPDTLITSSKETLLAFAEEHEAIVCKSIQNVVHLARENEVHINYTEALDLDTINELPSTFFPSKFQELIPKEFEVRKFFLNGECWSMAIFSQRDDQTKVDFRKYNDAKRKTSPCPTYRYQSLTTRDSPTGFPLHQIVWCSGKATRFYRSWIIKKIS